jgi:membrane-associated phospholipid phosphatase
VAGCLVAGRLNGAMLAVLTVPAATGLDEAVLKPLVDRTYLGSLAYPSGHVTTVSALAATLTVLLLVPPQSPRTRVPRVLLLLLAWAVTCVVAVAVISLRWHYLTDTIAGAAVGAGMAGGIALLIDLRVVRRGMAALGGRPS